MNSKITFPKLATMLADDSGRSKRFSEDFLREFFSLISERLVAGEAVKVKGLGTFRVSRVEPRKSVDVTTGLPMEIAGHSKVVFIPAKEMAEAVNAPFEAFTAIEIGDDVEVSSLNEEDSLNIPLDDAKIALEEESNAIENAKDSIDETNTSLAEEKALVEEEVEFIEETEKYAEEVIFNQKDPEPSTDEVNINQDETETSANEADEELELEEEPIQKYEETPGADQSFDIAEVETDEDVETREPAESVVETDAEVILDDTYAEEDIDETDAEENLGETDAEERVTTDTEEPAVAETDTDDKSESGVETWQDEESETGEEAEEVDEERVGRACAIGSMPRFDTENEISGRRHWTKGFVMGMLACLFLIALAAGITALIVCPDRINTAIREAFASNTEVEEKVIETDISLSEDHNTVTPTLSDTDKDGIKATEEPTAATPEKIEVTKENEVPTQPSDAVVYDTISKTRYLTTMAKAHYGNYNLWPIIYEENKEKLGHPDRIRPGTPVVIPKLNKYGIDPFNKKDVEKIKQLGIDIYARYGKKI